MSTKIIYFYVNICLNLFARCAILKIQSYDIVFTVKENEIVSKTEMEPGDRITASFTVKNTGKRSGETVVRLYIHDRFASLVRPIRELKGYKKISLEAGEEKTIFELP